MMKLSVTLTVLYFLLISTLFAGLSEIPAFQRYNIPDSWTGHGRSNFTWDWVGPEGGVMRRVIVDPSNNNLGLSISEGGDLWRTVDGNSWLLVPNFIYQQPSWGLYTSSNKAIVSVYNLLFNTTDGGNNWTQNPQSFIDIGGLSETVSNIVYLADVDSPDVYVCRSTDEGVNWTVIDTLAGVSIFHLIRFDPSFDSTIFVSVTDITDTTKILKSTDMGSSWTIVLQNNATVDFSEVDDIEINPYNSNEIFVCFGFGGALTGPYYSSNGGSSWQQLPGALAALLLIPFDVEFTDSNNIIVTNLFPPGIFRGMRIAGQWQFFKVDSTVAFLDVELGSSGITYASTMGDGIYKSTTGGNSWFPVKTNLRAFLASYNFENVSLFNGSTLYASSQFSTPVFKTTDGGLTWQEFYCPEWIFKQAIEVYAGNPDIVYLSGLGVKANFTDTLFFSFYQSTDGGVNWTPIDTIPNPDSSTSFNSLWVSPSDSSKLLGVLPTWSSNYLYYSTNSGRTWTQIFSNVNSRVIGTDTVFVQVNDTLYVSFDKGASWQPLALNQYIKEMSYNPGNKLLFAVRGTGNGDSLSSISLSGSITNYADVSGGMHSMSTPGGNDIYLSFWTSGFMPLFIRSPDGGLSFDVDTLSFLPTLLRASPNEILLADLAKSFRRSTDAVGVSNKPNRPSYNFNVRITPQLFKSKVKIDLSLPQMNYVKITIRSIDGRLVETINNGMVGAGLTCFEWNGKNNEGKNLPSAVYFVKISVGRSAEYTAKVVKLK